MQWYMIQRCVREPGAKWHIGSFIQFRTEAAAWTFLTRMDPKPDWCDYRVIRVCLTDIYHQRNPHV